MVSVANTFRVRERWFGSFAVCHLCIAKGVYREEGMQLIMTVRILIKLCIRDRICQKIESSIRT